MENNYEISSNTLLLYSIKNNETIIYESDIKYNINKKSSKIIDNSCRFFGSSLSGRQEGTKSLIGTSIKAPVIIEESKNIIFFPTSSPRNNICNWISYNNLIKYEKIDNNYTKLYFSDGFIFDINVSYNIIDNQVTRCIKLEKIFLKRKRLFK